MNSSLDLDQDDDEGINEINITPFVDVVLVLLVIFMIAAPIMVKQSLDINLPSSKSSDPSVKPKSLGISINKNNQILVNGELQTENSLLELAQSKFNTNANIQALLTADKKSYHETVIKVIDIVKRSGITNFAFQIEKNVKDQTPNLSSEP